VSGVPSLPVVGTTWLRRGPGYWLRRPPSPDDVPATRRELRNLRAIATYVGPAIVILILLAIFATDVFQALIFVLLVGFAAAAAGPYLVFFWRSLGRELPVEEALRVGLGLPAPGDPARAAAVDEFMRDEST
jgi:hypothetical protein